MSAPWMRRTALWVSSKAACADYPAKCWTTSNATTASVLFSSAGHITTTQDLNQGILDAFQDLGYPVLSQSYLPLDSDLLDRLFGDEVGKGIIESPLDISDVWKNSSSANTNHKIWAAKFAARHPNLIPVELSNFKCGHDAFVSGVIEHIVESSGKPYFCFRDLDENKPPGLSVSASRPCITS